MSAKVREIQVCGGKLAVSIEDACREYLAQLPDTDRPKLAFVIILSSGETKHITIRQTEEGVIAYGDFEGLPSMLDYAQEVSDAKQ